MPGSEWASGREGFTTGEVLAGCLDIEPSRWDVSSQRRVGEILRRLDLSPRRTREPGGGYVRRYYRLPDC